MKTDSYHENYQKILSFGIKNKFYNKIKINTERQ